MTDTDRNRPGDAEPGDAEAFFDRFARVIDDAAGGLAKEHATTADPLLGQIVGHYRIDARLGEGGMGVVYRALDTRLNRVVALKFLPDHLNADARAKQRFLSEARAAAALDHPNICNIYEVNETEARRSFIAMAYYDGATLETLLENGPLPWPQAVDYAAQIARGLSAAHERGIVHRDVKPGNVMITPNGVAKLLDFGIARSAEAARLTATGATIGTLAYMSPEQASGRPIDARTDLWSLGVLLYEMCTGARPFRGKTAPALLNAILNEQPPSAAKLRRELPSEVDAVIARCLEKDPASRYLDAAEVIADLTRVSSVPQTGAVPTRRSRSWLMPGAIAGIVLAALIGTIVWRLTGDRLDVDPNRVAVIPFELRSGNDSLRTFGAILADIVANGLTRTGNVSVAPVAVVMAASAAIDAASTPDKLRALARETRAGVIVSGSYFVNGDSLYINTEVIDVRRDRRFLPIEVVTVPIGEQLGGVQAVLQRVLVALSPRIDFQDLSPAAATVDLPMNLEAYREYMAGLERVVGVRNWDAALEHFYRAVRLDSTSGAALNMLALSEWHANNDLPKVDSILRIVATYRDLPPYDRAQHDWLRAWLDGDIRGSLNATQRMSTLTGRTTASHAQDANRLNLLREAETIRTALETPAGRRNPLAWHQLTHVLHVQGEHDHELREARRGIEEVGESAYTLALEIRALAALGRTDELRVQLDKHKARSPTSENFKRVARELRYHGDSLQADTFGHLAERWYREAIEKAPTMQVRLQLAETLYDLQKWDAARSLLDSLAADIGTAADTVWRRDSWYDIQTLGYVGLDAARRRDTARANAMIERLARYKRAYLWGSNIYWQARIVAQLGDCERTVKLLEEALRSGTSPYYAEDEIGLEVPQFEALTCARFTEFRKPKD